MEEKEIRDLIDELQDNNPLVLYNEYREEFIKRFLKLDFKKTHKNKSKLLKCLAKGETTRMQDVYRQGISEILLWFLMNSKNIGFATEVKENPENKHDVDVVINDYQGCRYNIEIKSPELSENHDGTIHGEFVQRLGETRAEANTIRDGFDALFEEATNKAGKVYSGISLPNDTKIMSTLQSCQQKFTDPSPENFNCLLIVTTSEEMVRYWEYIINNYNGYFDPGSPLPHEDFDKVNAIILSNALSMNERFDNNSWDLESSCNIVIPNPYSKSSAELKEQYVGLGKLFPNCNIRFVNYLKKNNTDNECPLFVWKNEFVKTWTFDRR